MVELRKHQQEAVDAVMQSFEKCKTKPHPCLAQLATACHKKGHPILLANGKIVPVEEVKVGDELMSPTGKKTVLELRRGQDEMYEITPLKGEPFVVNKGHILHLIKYVKHRGWPNTEWAEAEEDISVEEYLKLGKTQKHYRKLVYGGYTDGNKPDLPFSPWVIGAYLGDGSVFTSKNRSPIFTNIDRPVIRRLETELMPLGISLRKHPGEPSYTIIEHCRGHKSNFKKIFFELEIMERERLIKKFPQVALGWDYDSRAELLAGLLDADGSYTKRGFDFVSKHKDIAQGVVRLARSLGIMATWASCKKSCQTFTGPRAYYRVWISGTNADRIPCAKWKVGNNKQRKNPLKTGFKIKSIGVDNYYGFLLDGDHLYYDGNLLIHHNSGKSYICAEIARLHQSALILAPTKEIVEQNYEKLIALGIPRQDIGICSASAGSHAVNRVTIGTIGTVKSFANKLKDVDVVIIDESDVVPIERSDSEYMSFLQQLTTNRICGLTATTWRNQVFKRQFEEPRVYCRPLTRIPTDKKSDRFGQWFWSGGMVYRCGVRELQELGYLSPVKYIVQKTDWSFLDRALGRVDYDEQQLGIWANIDGNREIFERALSWAAGQFERTLVFAPNIAASHSLCSIARRLGIEADTIDSQNDNRKSREAKLKRFREGKTQVLFNVAILTAGYDLPSLDCVLMCRATKSLRLYVQSIGRALRIDPEKPDKIAQVVDMAGNMERFGRVEDIIMTQVDAVASTGWKYKKDVIAYKPLGSEKYKILDRVS